MNRYIKLSILVNVIAISCTVTYAAQAGIENDAPVITKAKNPTAHALTRAQQHANGKAARADYENAKVPAVYDLGVVRGATIFNVKIDAGKASLFRPLKTRRIAMLEIPL